MEKKEDGRCTRDGSHSRGTRHVKDFQKKENRKQPAEVNTRGGRISESCTGA